MSAARQREYFAALPPLSKEFAAAALERFHAHIEDMKASHRHQRMRRMWCMYYSKARDGGWDDTEIQMAGPNGEVTLIRPNEIRNLMQHQLNLVTQSPPAFECVAVNSDSDSMAEAARGNGILDYYLYVHHLDDVRVERAELALVFGESHLHMRWDANAGKEYAVKDEPVFEADGKTPKMRDVTPEEAGMQPSAEMAVPVDGMQAEPANDNAQPMPKVQETRSVPVHEGEFTWRVNTPYDVAYDPNAKDKNRPRWVIICEPENRWDLAAQYPDFREQILDAEPYSKHVAEIEYIKQEYQHDDYIPVYYVYVEKSAAVREGREALVLNDSTCLTDGPLSEDRIPNFRLVPSNVIFQSGGYTNNFDLMPLQEVYAAQMSTVLSNHTAFGKQWVITPKGTNVKPHHVNRGLGVMEYDSLPGMPPPQALNLLASQEEHLTFAEMIRAIMERYAVIPANIRGEGTKGDSGSKEALIAASAQQFASSFHRALSRSDQDLGTHLIASLRSHASTKRVATIVGRYSAYSSVEFEGKDLEKIARVTVRASDASRDTAAGREAMADKLLQFPDGIVSAEQYIMFLETGRVEPMFEGTRDELMCIRRENEDMRDGKPAPVSKWDKHSLHIKEHKGKMADKAVRQDPKLVALYEEHLAMHLGAIDPTSPNFAGIGVLLTIGEKPLPMPQPAGPPMPGVDNAPPPANDNGAPPKQAKPPSDANGSAGTAPGMPSMPKPPKNALTGQPAQIAKTPPKVTQQ